MSLLLGNGDLPSGYIFEGVTATPVGGDTGILPANGEIVSLAEYPGLAYLNNNVGYLAGPAFSPQFGAAGFNVNQSSGTNGEMLYVFAAAIGPYYILCGNNNVPNTSTGIGASLSISSDCENWTLSQINTVVGTSCVGITKLGTTYYALVNGNGGEDYIYESTNLTSWTVAFSYAGGAPIYGVSQMAASPSIVVSLQGGCDNITFFNGANWIFDSNNVAESSYQSVLNVLSTGEIGGITLTSYNATPVKFSAWKVGVGNTASTINPVEPNFTGSALCPIPGVYSDTAVLTPFNAKLSYVGGNYVANIFGIVYTSPDFVHWTKQADMRFIAMENIGGTLYGISITSSGVNQYFSSPDGINWTLYYTSTMSQGFIPALFGARILEISPTLWAVCSAVADQFTTNLGGVYGQQGAYVSFIFNPTTVPVVMQSVNGISYCVTTFCVNPSATGVFAGNSNLIPPYNPTLSAQLPTLTSSAGAGTAMFMKI